MSFSAMAPLHVLVVDDSAVVREVLIAVLSQEPGVHVVTAADPLIAMIKMARQRPDVIVLDLEMPRMSGLAFLRKIMSESPIPVVVCSAYVGDRAALGLQALDEGALELVAKPNIGVREFLYESAVLLIDAIHAAAKSKVKQRRYKPQTVPPVFTADAVLPPRSSFSTPLSGAGLVAIGASTGGTEALRLILEAMPKDAPAIVVVQHMPEGFTAAFAKRLNQTCKVHVKEAVQHDPVVGGRVLIAPGNRHMIVRRTNAGYHAEVMDGPLVSRHRPSVDVLFRSTAQSAGSNAIGVILTGMGSDGARGLLEMKNAGALTIAQDEKSCIVFGMSKEAIECGAVRAVAPLQAIPEMILKGALCRSA